MRYLFILLLLILTILSIFSCGWHNSMQIPNKTKKMVFESYNSNDYLSRTIRNKLCLKGIKIIEKRLLHDNVPTFCLIKAKLSNNTISIYQNGLIAEYQMILLVDAKVLVPINNTYKISVETRSLLIDNQESAIAKDTKKQFIINEMYDKAAEELIRKAFKYLQ